MEKNSKIKNWIDRDLKYIWHPFTQMKDCLALPPIFLERAKGIKLYDAKGRFYYDTISSWWSNVHGHNHPKIKKAITGQLSRLEHVLFAGFTHKSAILTAEKLIAITPKHLTKIFFSDNGSTAVEVALKMSFQYWKNTGKSAKHKFISLDAGYHGDTVGAMSVSGLNLFNRVFAPLFFKTFKVPTPYCYRCPMKKQRATCKLECTKPLEDILSNKKDEISAMIIEPLVLAAGGMIIYPPEYLKRVDELTKKYNVHLILDEVATGFGRTGKMFASEYTNIKADFMCLSKGITSGYLPLGATLTTDKIYKAFYADYAQKKTFYHGHTYTANPLSCQAALASLEIFEEEQTLKKIKKLIPVFHKEMEKFRNLKIVGDVRYIGLIGVVELVKDRKSKAPFDEKERIGLKIYQEGLKRNLILRPLGNIIYFYLPLCIKKGEVIDILGRAYKIIQKTTI